MFIPTNWDSIHQPAGYSFRIGRFPLWNLFNGRALTKREAGKPQKEPNPGTWWFSFREFKFQITPPGTNKRPNFNGWKWWNNHFSMVMIWNHSSETTTKKSWLFGLTRQMNLLWVDCDILVSQWPCCMSKWRVASRWIQHRRAFTSFWAKGVRQSHWLPFWYWGSDNAHQGLCIFRP